MARKPWEHNLSTTERGLGWAWQKQRRRILQRDNHMCQDCIAKGRATPARDCHHIIPRAKAGAALARDEDVISLCAECHKARDDAERGFKQPVRFDADGRVVW